MDLKKKKPNVVIIVLNWNGWKDTIECIESLYQINYANFDLVVVDNCSEDSSVTKIMDYAITNEKILSLLYSNDPKKTINNFEFIKKESENLSKNKNKTLDSKRIIIIENDRNYGFGTGNNIGIRFALKNLNPKYILILNNDTVVDKEFLNQLQHFMENNIDVGICSSIEYSYYNRKKLLTAGININKYGFGNMNASLKKPSLTEPFEVTYANGACIFIRSELIHELGCFDEKMFVGAEDMDLSLRSWIIGKKVLAVPQSIIYHKHNASIKKTPSHSITYYGIRSLLRCYIKNFQIKTLTIILFIFLFKQIGSFIIDITIRKDGKIAVARLMAFKWNFFKIKNTLKERKLIQKNRIFHDNEFLFN